MQSVTGGHSTTVEGWSRSHGLPYDHIQSVWVEELGTVFLLKGVCLTPEEYTKILPRLEYLCVLDVNYEKYPPCSGYLHWVTEQLRHELCKKYDAHLRQKNEQKTKQQSPVTYYDVLFHNRYAQALGMTFNRFVCQYVDSYVGSDAAMIVTDGQGDCDGVAVTRLKMCKIRNGNLPAYAVMLPENTQPFSEAGKLHNKYKNYVRGIAGDFRATTPYYSMNCASVRTHRTSSRKQGKTLQQEHAARVAHFESEKKSLGPMELPSEFCKELLRSINYLIGDVPSYSAVNCKDQSAYDYAEHYIRLWAAMCAKPLEWTFYKSYTNVKSGQSSVTLYKMQKHEGNIGQ